MGWSKPPGYFRSCVEAQQRGEERIWIAEEDGRYAGHVRLVWRVGSPPAPEIRDLAVLPEFRRRGLARRLVKRAEDVGLSIAPLIRLAVGLHPGFGAAQRLYVSLGYMPDGRGACRDGTPVPEGSSVVLDDDLVLVFEKHSSATETPPA